MYGKQNDMQNENISEDQEQTVLSCMSRGYIEKKMHAIRDLIDVIDIICNKR